MRKLLLVLCLVMLVSAVFASGDAGFIRKEWLRNNPGELPNWLTDDELTRLDEIGRDFSPTDPPVGPVRQVAEFEPMSGVLVRYSNGLSIPVSLVAEMSQDATVVTIANGASQQTSAQSLYASNGVNLDNCVFLNAPTDGQWTRDYGPWFIFDGNHELGVVNFIYNRPRPNDNDIPIEYAAFDTLALYGMSVAHTGGNYMCDGLGQAASTDLVFEENSLTQEEVRQFHLDFLGVTDYHVLEDPLGDYIKHIDCWGKFLGVDKVLIGRVPQSDPRYDDYEAVADYFSNTVSSWGTPFRVYRVDAPGSFPYTPYSNSLILNDKVFVPQTGHTLDDDALAVYEEAMPGYQIFGVDYSGWLNTDALHCRTHEIPDKGMLFVRHTPLQYSYAGCGASLEAYIYPHSGAALIADSLLVRYRHIDDDAWSETMLHHLGEHVYRAGLPAFAAGDTIEYYLHAVDQSGRDASHPFIGAPDPHRFVVVVDDTAPSITHTPYGTIYENEFPRQFFASFTDNCGVESATMTCHLDGETYAYDMAVHADTVWACAFNAPVEAGDIVTYAFTATDSTGNSATLPQDGEFSFEVIAMSADDRPEAGFLLSCSPNPVRGEASICFQLAQSQNVEVDVYNIRGQRVRSLAAGIQSSGSHSLRWDGRDTLGAPVASGLYFVRLKSAGAVQVTKLMVLR